MPKTLTVSNEAARKIVARGTPTDGTGARATNHVYQNRTFWAQLSNSAPAEVTATDPTQFGSPTIGLWHYGWNEVAYKSSGSSTNGSDPTNVGTWTQIPADEGGRSGTAVNFFAVPSNPDLMAVQLPEKMIVRIIQDFDSSGNPYYTIDCNLASVVATITGAGIGYGSGKYDGGIATGPDVNSNTSGAFAPGGISALVVNLLEWNLSNGAHWLDLGTSKGYVGTVLGWSSDSPPKPVVYISAPPPNGLVVCRVQQDGGSNGTWATATTPRTQNTYTYTVTFQSGRVDTPITGMAPQKPQPYGEMFYPTNSPTGGTGYGVGYWAGGQGFTLIDAFPTPAQPPVPTVTTVNVVTSVDFGASTTTTDTAIKTIVIY